MSSELENSLLETMSGSDLRNIAIDVADAGTSGWPVIGAIKAFGESIHSYYYTKKVLSFLGEVSSVPKEKRQEQFAKMMVVPGEREKFAEHLAMMIDRMNEIEKAKMMGKVAAAYLREEISFDDLKSLNYALDIIDLRMVDVLKEAFTPPCRGDNPACQMLAYSGLMAPLLEVDTETLSIGEANFTGAPGPMNHYQTFKDARIDYIGTELGRMFINICLSWHT